MKKLHLLLWAVYPLLVYAGLMVLEPRVLALALGAVLIWRQRRVAAGLYANLGAAQRLFIGLLLALTLATALTNSETLLRCYPVAMNAGLLAIFGLSLVHPPTIVERIARLRMPALDAAGLRYTRRVTQVWCAFFLVNGTIAAWTALFASRELWALYNGGIAYVLMGLLFGVELLTRRRAMAAPVVLP
ncbi:MAG: hypothetical protein ACREUW_12680 [Burkholderiales bacterium]